MTQDEKFINWVNSLSLDELYEEFMQCRTISFGAIDGDDKDYFASLINALKCPNFQALKPEPGQVIDKSAELLPVDNKKLLMDFYRWLERRGFLREDLCCDPEHQIETFLEDFA